MIEDIIAQAHIVVDSLTFQEGIIALSALRTICDGSSHTGAFSQLLGMKFHNLVDGQCTASLEVKEHLLNPIGRQDVCEEGVDVTAEQYIEEAEEAYAKEDPGCAAPSTDYQHPKVPNGIQETELARVDIHLGVCP